MRVNGSFALQASGDRVWAALTDPAVLAVAVPGCERFEPGAGSARLTVTATVAATTAAYAVGAHVTARQQPGSQQPGSQQPGSRQEGSRQGGSRQGGSRQEGSLAVTFDARGEPGSLTGTVRLRIVGGDAATQVSYEADAEATGQLAAVGRSLLAATAKRLATRFFEALDEALARAPDLAGPVQAAHPPVHAATAGAAGPATMSPATVSSAVGSPATVSPAAESPAVVSRAGETARRPLPGKGFAPGLLVGAAVGVAAAKLGSLLARRNR
jgi:hypothetical protein